MGSYSQLYLDKYYFAWKYDIPSFLNFFFKEDMFYKEEEVFEVDEEEESESVYNEIGYKCTVDQSINILNENGYDFSQVVDVYSFFYEEIYNDIEQQLFERLASINPELSINDIEEKVKNHIASFPVLTREEELRDFCKKLPKLIDISHEVRFSGYISINFEELQMSLGNRELEFSPWILLICQLFDWDMLQEYFEILSMFYFRLFLESIPKHAIIRLDLSDIIDEEEDIKELHSELATRLVNKISLYNKFFNPLLIKEDFVKEKYIKRKGSEYLKNCLSEKNSYVKGQMLEKLIELIFTSNKSLEISSSRVKTGDEEIDLVIVNKMESTFWLAFGSMFFVECKNWNKKIGAKEMRDFETKLRNHNNVTKLGFFISINGFTKEAINHLKRIGRENYHIVLIGKPEIEEYINGTMSLFDWLAKKVEKIY